MSFSVISMHLCDEESTYRQIPSVRSLRGRPPPTFHPNCVTGNETTQTHTHTHKHTHTHTHTLPLVPSTAAFDQKANDTETDIDVTFALWQEYFRSRFSLEATKKAALLYSGVKPDPSYLYSDGHMTALEMVFEIIMNPKYQFSLESLGNKEDNSQSGYVSCSTTWTLQTVGSGSKRGCQTNYLTGKIWSTASIRVRTVAVASRNN